MKETFEHPHHSVSRWRAGMGSLTARLGAECVQRRRAPRPLRRRGVRTPDPWERRRVYRPRTLRPSLGHFSPIRPRADAALLCSPWRRKIGRAVAPLQAGVAACLLERRSGSRYSANYWPVTSGSCPCLHCRCRPVPVLAGRVLAQDIGEHWRCGRWRRRFARP